MHSEGKLQIQLCSLAHSRCRAYRSHCVIDYRWTGGGAAATIQSPADATAASTQLLRRACLLLPTQHLHRAASEQTLQCQRQQQPRGTHPPWSRLRQARRVVAHETATAFACRWSLASWSPTYCASGNVLECFSDDTMRSAHVTTRCAVRYALFDIRWTGHAHCLQIELLLTTCAELSSSARPVAGTLNVVHEDEDADMCKGV